MSMPRYFGAEPAARPHCDDEEEEEHPRSAPAHGLRTHERGPEPFLFRASAGTGSTGGAPLGSTGARPQGSTDRARRRDAGSSGRCMTARTEQLSGSAAAMRGPPRRRRGRSPAHAAGEGSSPGVERDPREERRLVPACEDQPLPARIRANGCPGRRARARKRNRRPGTAATRWRARARTRRPRRSPPPSRSRGAAPGPAPRGRGR